MTTGPATRLISPGNAKPYSGTAHPMRRRDADENERIAFAQRLVKTDNPVITRGGRGCEEEAGARRERRAACCPPERPQCCRLDRAAHLL
jgi:hypothetical protein